MNTIEYHWISMNTIEYHWISTNTIEYHWISTNTIESLRIPLNLYEYHWIPLNLYEYHWIPLNLYEYHWILLNLYEYHWNDLIWDPIGQSGYNLLQLRKIPDMGQKFDFFWTILTSIRTESRILDLSCSTDHVTELEAYCCPLPAHDYTWSGEKSWLPQ